MSQSAIQRRKALLKQYGYLYKNNYDLDQSKCLYCGEAFYCYDHKPAISICPDINMKEYNEQHGEFILIPSCKVCNEYLYNRRFMSVLDCLFFLKDRYNNRLCKTPLWKEDELKTMSYHMQCIINSGQYKRNLLIDKIAIIDSNILEYEYGNNFLAKG